MKIVTYEEFVRMPAGTIFAPFKPNVFEDEFKIKVDGGKEMSLPLAPNTKVWVYNGTMPLRPWLGDDFFTYGENDVELEIYDGDQNDVRDYDMIAVLEPHDVKELINALYWALDGCPDCSHHDYKEKEKNDVATV